MSEPRSERRPDTESRQDTGKHSFPALWPGALGMLILLISVFPTAGDIHKHYYDYILPTVVLVLSVVMVVLACRCRRWAWVLPFVVLVVFFNPVWRPSLGTHRAWAMADFAGAVLFLLGAYFVYPKPRTPQEEAGTPPRSA